MIAELGLFTSVLSAITYRARGLDLMVSQDAANDLIQVLNEIEAFSKRPRGARLVS